MSKRKHFAIPFKSLSVGILFNYQAKDWRKVSGDTGRELTGDKSKHFDGATRVTVPVRLYPDTHVEGNN